MTGGVWGSCCLSLIPGLVDEGVLVVFAVEPFQEEFVGVVGGFIADGTGVEGFYTKIINLFIILKFQFSLI